MERIAVVGAGLIGRAWAIVFARAGCSVALWDKLPGVADAAMEQIRARLGDLRAAGLVDEAPDAIAARIAPVAGLEACLAGVVHVQEQGPERLDVKRALFTEARRTQPAARRARVLHQRHPGQRLHRSACRGGTAAWSPTRSTRPTWCRSWNWWARPGPAPRRWRAHAR